MQPEHQRPTQVELIAAGDTEFCVEVVDAGGPRPVGLDDTLTFDGVRDAVHAIAGQLAEVWQQVRPAEACVEFGLSATVRSGKLTGLLLADAGGTASLKITLTWRDNPKAAGAS